VPGGIAHGGDPKLLGMILDGALSDPDLYISSQWTDNLCKLPLLTQQRMRQLEAANAFGSRCYKAIEQAISSQFTHRLLPPAQCFRDSLAGCNGEIYVAMQGASEFVIAGALGRWRCTERLCAVTCPTLVMRGEFDTMTHACSMAVVNGIPGCRPLVTIPRAGHCKLLDEPIACAEAMGAFLASLNLN
jgi:pimeloyl-ACP methyl ester carboxylesterase